MENTVLNDVVNDVAQVATVAEDLGGAFSAARWAYAGEMTLLGMVMIFMVLGALWGILAIFSQVMTKKAAKPVVAPVVSAPAPVVAETAPVVSSSDDEVIAAYQHVNNGIYEAKRGLW